MKGMICMKCIGTINKKETNLLFYYLFIISGIIIGSFCSLRYDISSFYAIDQGFLPLNKDISIVKAFFIVFIPSLFLLLTAFLSGLSAVGQPVELFILIYRGFGIGSAVTSLYTEAGSSAVMQVAVMILPKAVAFSALAALSVKEAVHFSSDMMHYCIYKEGCVNESCSFRAYCIRFIVLIALSLTISASDRVIAYFFQTLTEH